MKASKTVTVTREAVDHQLLPSENLWTALSLAEKFLCIYLNMIVVRLKKRCCWEI